MQPACMRALKRIFTVCDRDGDGYLSDVELNEFQVLLLSKKGTTVYELYVHQSVTHESHMYQVGQGYGHYMLQFKLQG